MHKLNLAIVEKQSQKIIGYCGLGPDDVKNTEIEIYYGISEAYRGRGITAEATKALMNYAFYRIGLLFILKTWHLYEL
ncbi:GNAT family N-acetyltransferase [Lysinibacillus sp. NPDC096382]|uniref:GNAT family N-acetyltransferase n=1 Tax=Lysinibacillus sp. NPDC096382 TaxID=3364136 RepID=UPI00381D87B2